MSMTGRPSAVVPTWFSRCVLLIASRTRVLLACLLTGPRFVPAVGFRSSLLQERPVPGIESQRYLRPFGLVLTRIPGTPHEYPTPLLLMFKRNGPKPIDLLKRHPMSTYDRPT